MRVEDTSHFGQLFPTQTCILCLPQPTLLCDLEVVTPPRWAVVFYLQGKEASNAFSITDLFRGLRLRQAILIFARSHIFKNYFCAMSQLPYCATISSAIHSSQSCLQAPITLH